MKRTHILLAAALIACGLSTGCHHLRYSKVNPDGSTTSFIADSLFSNTAVKGLTVDGSTKTTSQGLRVNAGATEPNPEAITATGSALGDFTGSAAAAMLKGKP